MPCLNYQLGLKGGMVPRELHRGRDGSRDALSATCTVSAGL